MASNGGRAGGRVAMEKPCVTMEVGGRPYPRPAMTWLVGHGRRGVGGREGRASICR